MKTKKKKESQYKEKIRPICAEEFDLNQEEEVLSSSKKALGDNRMLKNNKNSYRVEQETHLDEDCVIDS